MFKIFSTYICWIYKMQRLEVSGAVRPMYRSLGFKGLKRLRTAELLHNIMKKHDKFYVLDCPSLW